MARLPRLFWMLLGLQLLVSACGSSQPETGLIEMEVDERFVDQRLEQMLVIGLAYLPVNRQLFEDQLGESLEARGLTVLRSYELLGDTEVTRDTIVAALEGTDTDAVLLTRIVDFESMSLEQTPTTTSGSGAFSTYVEINSSSLRQPVEGQVVVLETVLFDLATEDPMWRAVTETFDPASVSEVVEGIAEAVRAGMRERGFL